MKFILGEPMKPATNRLAGSFIKLERRAVLLDVANVQHDDPIGHGHGFDLIVGHVDHVVAKLLVQLGDLDAHLDAQRGIEIGQRLVEQKRLGLAHDGAADRHALALTARQFAAACGRDRGSRLRMCGGLGDFRCRSLPCGMPGHLQPEGDVVAHAHVRIERVGLEHHRQPTLGRRHVDDVDAVDEDVRRRSRPRARDQAQQRGLAAARRPDEHHELAFVRCRGRRRG